MKKILYTSLILIMMAGCAAHKPIMPTMDLPPEPVKPKINFVVIQHQNEPYLALRMGQGAGAPVEFDYNSATRPAEVAETAVSTALVGNLVAIHLREARYKTITLGGNIVIFPPNDSGGDPTKFTLKIIGDASSDYTVSWGKGLYAKKMTVPAGWYALVDFDWDGDVGTVTRQKLYYSSGSNTLDFPSINSGSFAESGGTPADISNSSLQPGDKITVTAARNTTTDYVFGFTGRVIIKGGAAYVRTRAYNHTADTVNLASNSFYYQVERDVLETAGSGVVRTAEVELSSAEILALRATPINIVPAPGAGTWVELISATAIVDYNSAAYVEPDTNNLEIQYATSGVIAATIESTGLVDATADTAIKVSGVVPVTALSNLVNQALKIKNNGAAELTTGNSPIRIIVNYLIHDDTLPGT